MDEKRIQELLSKPNETDWLEFKRKMKLFKSDGSLVELQRDEFLKDVIGLTNGNSHTIRKTKYLIWGAGNKEFDKNGERLLFDVNYRVPSQSEISIWIKSACAPSIAGLECELVLYKQIHLFIVTIPPTFDLHETTRELITSSATFQKHTVFIRQDEHINPASVRDGVTIQQLKHLYRQEVANPPSLWIGALVGGVVALIISQAKIQEVQLSFPLSSPLFLAVLTGIGIFFGATIGWATKVFNETRYDWRYMTIRQKYLMLLVILSFVSSFILLMR